MPTTQTPMNSQFEGDVPMPSPITRPLISTLSPADPALLDLLHEFVCGLSARIEQLRAAVSAGDRARLKVLAHQLRGAGGSYGYPEISQAAGLLEDTQSSEQIALLVERIARLSDAARAGLN
jgi:HPt (histidine-containing phosphotransfer) domain-containing protein